MGKRGTSGGGTVRTRKDGLKEARVLVPKEYRAVAGKTYLYFYGKTEREAKNKRSAALSDLIQRGPRVFDARRITFGDWLERWIDSLPGTVAQNTQGFYEHRARTYLKPTLGNVKLSELTAEHLDGLYRDLSRGKGTPSGRPLAASTVGQIHSTARVALGRAAKKGVITHNVARAADAPRVEKKERPTLDLNGLEAFFGAAAGERLEALWIVWCLTGFRPREVFGLKWVDVRLPKDDSDVELLQKVLGHSSITTTINTYSHLSPRYQRESFGRFGDALGSR